MVPWCLCVSVHLSPQLFLLQPSSLAALEVFVLQPTCIPALHLQMNQLKVGRYGLACTAGPTGTPLLYFSPEAMWLHYDRSQWNTQAQYTNWEMSFILMGHLDGNLNGPLMFDLHSEIELKCHCHVV